LRVRLYGKQADWERLHGLVPETLSSRRSCRSFLHDGVTLAYHDRSVGLSKSCREVDVIVMPFAEACYP
jgi:hypothetical protein